MKRTFGVITVGWLCGREFENFSRKGFSRETHLVSFDFLMAIPCE